MHHKILLIIYQAAILNWFVCRKMCHFRNRTSSDSLPLNIIFIAIADFDECASSPCGNNGTCIGGTNIYNCACAAGFMGGACETSKNIL